MISLRPVLLVNGLLLATLGSAMMLPAIVDLYFGDDDWLAFAAASGLTLFVGGALALANFGHATELTTKQAFLLTTLSWLLITAFAALPFSLSRLNVGYADAFFEAMSGVTTTGATVLTGLDSMPKGILLWRGLLQWLGGIGIIVMAIAVMPMLRVGGMQLFRLESSDNSGKILPRARQIAASIAAVYVALSVVCFAAYFAAGMTSFEAVVHSMTTIATGGFSTRDASIGGFASIEIELIAIFFMLVSGMPFLLLWQGRYGDLRIILRDSQVKLYLVLILIFALLAVVAQAVAPVALFQAEASTASNTAVLAERLRGALFSTISVMTGTGYATVAYDSWSAFGTVLFFVIMFVGGCAGSACCGLKIFRIHVMMQTIRMRVLSFSQPSRVVVSRFNGKPIGRDVARAVMNFFFVFAVTFAAFAVVLNLQGLDPLTALSASISMLSCVGPGLGPDIGPAGNFHGLSDLTKWTLSFAMLLGRLELFTVIVLLTPAFWRG